MVALLTFADGESFATGAVEYLYQPATAGESTPRVLLRVEIEGVAATAVVDTGAPYVVCNPQIARQLTLNRTTSLGTERLLIRGYWLEGSLYRLNIKVRAEFGENISVEATTFVPDVDSEQLLGNLPCFIGLSGCLERIRFAVDPVTDTFYFGPLV